MHDLIRSFSATAYAGVLVQNEEGQIVQADRAAERILGRPLAELQGRHPSALWRLLGEDGAELPAERWPADQAARTGRPVHFATVGLDAPDGPRLWLRCTSIPVLDANDNRFQVVSALVDVTDAALGPDPSRSAQDLLRSVLESVWLMAVSLDIDGVIEYANPYFLQVTGYPRSAVIGKNWFRAVVSPKEAAEAEQAFREMLDSELRLQFKNTVVTQEGEERLVSWSHVLLRDGDGRVSGALYVGEDVTERKRAEDALQHQSLHDALTGLPNRVLLQDRLDQAMLTAFREGHGIALAIMDIDGFRDVNDALGHETGDRLLREVASRIRSALRASDTVARLSGDEFAAVLLKAGERERAEQAARKIQKALEQPIVLDNQPFHVSVSIGLALCPEHGEDVNTLMRRADVAMYMAKRANSGFAFYASERDEGGPSRLALLGELRQAIEQDQLIVYYQPSLNLKTGRVDRVEALVRWMHPKRGLIPPDEFIALAEQSGLIQALSKWVLRAVLLQRHHWTRDGVDVGVAVNLSMRNLHDPTLPDMIAELLRSWNVPATSLTVELTENTIMSDPVRAMDVLRRLREMGIEIAIDDFGTGYSSLAYLRQLPVTEIKIDKSFVLDLANSDDDAFIVRSTLNLGHDLGLKVVAEGVESQPILDLLHALGVDAMQGYHLSRPIPPDEFVRWFNDMSSVIAGVDQPQESSSISS